MRYVFLLVPADMVKLTEWLDRMEKNNWYSCHYTILHPAEGMEDVVEYLAEELLASTLPYPSELGDPQLSKGTELLQEVWKATRQSGEEKVLIVLLEKHTVATRMARSILEEKFHLEVPPFLVPSLGEAYFLDLRRRSLPRAI